jgi:hypothetical protein
MEIKGISNDRAPSIMGLNSFSTTLRVWQEIIEEQRPGWNAAHGFLLPEQEETASMRWGKGFKGAIIKILGYPFIDKHIIDKNKIIHKQGPKGMPLTSRIDGIIIDMSAGILCVAKTASPFSFRNSWGNKSIPDTYYVQVQHELYLTGLKKAFVICIEFPQSPEQWEAEQWEIIACKSNSGFQLKSKDSEYFVFDTIDWALSLHAMGFFHTYEIEANETAQSILLEQYELFWESIQKETMPKPADYDDIKRIFPNPKGTVIVPGEMKNKILEYQDITNQAYEFGRIKEAIKISILSWAREQKTTIDDESTESLILMDDKGEKLGSFGKTKTGTLVFRT